MSTTIPGFDPQKWWNGAAACGQTVVYESLLTLNPYTSNSLTPTLSTGMPKIDKGNTRFTYKLRPGVKFTDGTPLTSADVKYSFERLVVPSVESQASSVYNLLPIVGMSDVLNEKAKTLTGITTPDPLTIVFDFEFGDSTFIWVNSLNLTGVVPQALMERVGFNKLNWAPVGTGPFTAQVINPDEKILLHRNSKYWTTSVPKYAGVNWQLGIDDTLSMIRIESGQDDMMWDPVPAGFVANVLRPNYVADHQTVKTRENNCYSLRLNTKDPILSNLDVRKAIAMAINKPRVLQTMHALGAVANGSFFSPLSPYYEDGVAYSYNPRAAKELIQKANLPKSATLKMWSSNHFPYPSIGQVIQQDLAAIGLKVDFIPMEYNAFVTLEGNRPEGMVIWAYELAYPHGSYIVDTAFTSTAIKGGTNFTNFSTPTIDKLAVEGHRTFDQAKLADIYRQVARIVVQDEALWVPLIYPDELDFVSARVRNFQASVGAGEDQPRFFANYELV